MMKLRGCNSLVSCRHLCAGTVLVGIRHRLVCSTGSGGGAGAGPAGAGPAGAGPAGAGPAIVAAKATLTKMSSLISEAWRQRPSWQPRINGRRRSIGGTESLQPQAARVGDLLQCKIAM